MTGGANNGRTTRRTQAERRATSERMLLTAAAEIIIERGSAGASMAEIGRRAGYSHAAANHVFGSKAGLIERMHDAVTTLFAEQAEAAVAGRSGLDALTAVMRTYLDVVRGPDPIGRVQLVLWAESLASHAQSRTIPARWDREFRDGIAILIRQGIVDGTIRPDIDVPSTATFIVALLRGLAAQTPPRRSRRHNPVDIDTTVSLIEVMLGK